MKFDLYIAGAPQAVTDTQINQTYPDLPRLISWLQTTQLERNIKERRELRMGFDLYFAGSRDKKSDDFLAQNLCPRLFSQLNDRKSIQAWMEYAKKGKLFIDSGAHSAHTRGVELDVDEYINYVNEHDDEISIFAQVDKIPGVYRQHKTEKDWAEAPALSWENYKYMRERVKSPDKLIPVFHQGEDWKWLKNMCEATFDGKHIPYIGLSPRGDVKVKDKEEFVKKGFQIIKDSSNPNVKVHAFGMTTLSLLERYPFYSADSTTWLLVAAMGQINTPWGIVYVSEQKSREGHIDQLPPQVKAKIEAWLKELGYTLEDVATSHVARSLVNCAYLKHWADNYQYKPATRKLTSLI